MRFPFALVPVNVTPNTAWNMPFPPSTVASPPPRYGDDVLLTNVLAFDVQVYDPGAPIYSATTASSTATFEPRDIGFTNTSLTGGTPVAYGAYVDLAWQRIKTYSASGPTIPVPLFYSTSMPTAGKPNSGLTAPYVYDTWSLHYENDGLAEQNNLGLIDSGTNGLDDNSNGVVNELAEYDTLPPYQTPLRGVRILIRVYEPSSQQVREVTIVQDFLPE